MATESALLAMLATSAVSLEMRGSTWLYPIVEIVHIVGFSVLVGCIVMFDLRVLGFARSFPLRAAGQMLLPCAIASLLLIVPAGLLLFSAHPHELAMNKVFQLKLLLIAMAGVNAFSFHLGVYRTASDWQANTPRLARLHAALSLGLWIGVISCGRLLAYT